MAVSVGEKARVQLVQVSIRETNTVGGVTSLPNVLQGVVGA
jgi:hypothetical protein